jgi:hypothetical protein
MREFGQDYLYRVSLEADSVWSKFSHKKVKPLYVVMSSKETARDYAERNIRSGLKVKSISLIAKQLAGSVFTGEIK